MNVPFSDLKLLHKELKQELMEEIGKIIDNASFILGDAVSDFENGFAELCGTKYCTGVSSGTDANHIALWAKGIGPGDEVLIPANTFIATAWGAALCGARPVFADCEPDSMNIDPSDAERRITGATKAAVAVHLYGQPADMDRLKEVCSAGKVELIEDAAQAHLAEYKGARAGSLTGTASFSFYPGKNLGAIGEAGALTTSDEDLNRKFRMLRDHGSDAKYYHRTLGHNYRMEGIQGAALKIKLKYLERWTNERRSAAAFYDSALKEIEQITLPVQMPYAKHVYHLYVIRTLKRDELMKHLAANGISAGLHYPVPIHLQECFRELGYRKGDFPVAESLAETCLSLPIFPGITVSQQSYVCEQIKHFFKR